MKQTTIPYIPALADLYSELTKLTTPSRDNAETQVRNLLRKASPGIEISACTWRTSEPDGAGKPLGTVKAGLKMGYSGTVLGLLYTLEGDELLVRHTQDWDMVCQDSCVECFIAAEPDASAYVNLEFNPLGTCWAQIGTDRKHREKLSIKAVSTIFRRGLITTKAMDAGAIYGENRFRWEMLVMFPLQEVGVLAKTINQISVQNAGAGCNAAMLEGIRLRANFYTTGDDLQKPVYQSWCAVDTPAPDFHQPGYFGTMVFGR